MLPTFETDRLILKPHTIDDLEKCIKMDIDPKVTEYIPGIWSGSHKHIAFLKERILESYPLGLGYWSIFSRDNSTDFLGWIHLLPVQDNTQAAEIGWRLKYLAWENEYATETALVIITYAFKIADFNQILACTHSDNNRSKEMIKRLVFRYITVFIYNGKIPSSSYEIRRVEYY